MEGLVEVIFENDHTRLTYAIAGMFVFGMLLCFQKVRFVSRELNKAQQKSPPPKSYAARFLAETIKHDAGSRANTAQRYDLKLSSHISMIRYIKGVLVLLGLIGTVIGFIIALSGVDPATASDISSMPKMVSIMIAGMSVALNTTLVGSVLAVWLGFNYQILSTATSHLLSALIKLGEAHAQQSHQA